MIIIPNELRYGDGVGYPLSSHAFSLGKGVRVNFFYDLPNYFSSICRLYLRYECSKYLRTLLQTSNTDHIDLNFQRSNGTLN